MLFSSLDAMCVRWTAEVSAGPFTIAGAAGLGIARSAERRRVVATAGRCIQTLVQPF